MGKKGISDVITTVLLILLTIAAISLIAGVIIPWIKGTTEQSKLCFDATEKIKIELGKFTCYDGTNTKVMIRRDGSREFELKGLVISLTNEDGTANPYRIYNGTDGTGIGAEMNSGTDKGTLRIPLAGGAETYVFNIKSNYVRVLAILPNDKTCPGQEQEAQIENC